MAFNEYVSSWLSGVDSPPQLPLKPELTPTPSLNAQSSAFSTFSAPTGTSSPKRSSSPRRLFLQLRDAKPAICFDSISGSTENPRPASIDSLRNTLARNLRTGFFLRASKMQF